MTEVLRDWLGFVIGVFSLYLALRNDVNRHLHRKQTRIRSFKGWGIEWTAYDHEDDRQS